MDAIAQVLNLVSPAQSRDVCEIAVTSVSRRNRVLRILVAEDNEVNQIVAADFLKKAGYESLIVPDGEQAVRAAAEGRFDLILMDCQMPKMDGFEAARLIRRREEMLESSGKLSKRLPIVALTANASGADRRKCMEAGMNAYCGKPFRPRELLQTIDSLLAERAEPAAVSPPEEPTRPITGAPPINIEVFWERCTGNTRLALSILEKFDTQVHGAAKEIEALLGDVELSGR